MPTLKKFVTQNINQVLRLAGYEIRKYDRNPHPLPIDLMADKNFLKIYQQVQPYTLTGPERVFSLIEAVKYLHHNQINGALVECGVWKGGSAMAMALTLQELAAPPRELYLYDTFAGMTAPTAVDVNWNGTKAEERFRKLDRGTHNEWVYAPLEAVQKAMASTHYPREKIHYIKGKVEETIPQIVPATIALLRLDTDWYESTYHELKHLFDRVQKGGVIIIDDYGHWQGARQATDEFLAQANIKPYLFRIDYSGRLCLKL